MAQVFNFLVSTFYFDVMRLLAIWAIIARINGYVFREEAERVQLHQSKYCAVLSRGRLPRDNPSFSGSLELPWTPTTPRSYQLPNPENSGSIETKLPTADLVTCLRVTCRCICFLPSKPVKFSYNGGGGVAPQKSGEMPHPGANYLCHVPSPRLAQK